MTDVNSPTAVTSGTIVAEAGAARAVQPWTDAEQRLVTMVELLFFAYRDFTGEADELLAEIGLGRAHHRVMHFVNRNPGLRVADLLGILKITKQSLARVLKQLVDEGYVAQAAGKSDRRERRLFLTERGAELARRLAALQTQRLGLALAAAGPEAQEAARAFLFGVISHGERDDVARLVRAPELASAAGVGKNADRASDQS